MFLQGDEILVSFKLKYSNLRQDRRMKMSSTE